VQGSTVLNSINEAENTARHSHAALGATAAVLKHMRDVQVAVRFDKIYFRQPLLVSFVGGGIDKISVNPL